MTTGESCTFKIKAACGAPAFKVKRSSTALDETFDVSFLEYSSTLIDPVYNVSTSETPIA